MSDHYNSRDGAAKHAIYALFTKFEATPEQDHDECACQHQDVNTTQGCTFRVAICAYFTDPGLTTPNYKSYAWEVQNTTIKDKETGFSNVTLAAEAALEGMYKKFPAAVLKCGKPVVPPTIRLPALA